MAVALSSGTSPPRPTPEWLLKSLRKFSDDRVKMDKEGKKWAKSVIDKYVKGEIMQFFQQKAKIDIKELVFTGSAFESLKTEAADEADVMIVLKISKSDVSFEQEEQLPGFCRVKAKEESTVVKEGLVGDCNYVLPKKVMSWFFGLVQKMKNDIDSRSPENDVGLTLRSHGPAVQLDVEERKGSNKLSIDLVPAIECTERNEHLVPKYPTNDSKKPQCDLELLWRRSFSAKEKALLSDMDKVEDGCRKELLRIVKSIIRQEPTFHKLTSYHLKTAFLSYKDSVRSGSEWHKDKLAERFLGFLLFLHGKLVEKKLSHYWIEELDLLDGISEITLRNMESRLNKIYGNDNELTKILGASCIMSKLPASNCESLPLKMLTTNNELQKKTQEPQRDLLKNLRRFSNQRIKTQTEKIKLIKQHITNYVDDELKKFFQTTAKIEIKGCIRVGSTFENLRTEINEEAEVMIVLKVRENDITFHEDVSGYCCLKANEDFPLADKKLVDKNNFVLPEKLLSWFFGLVQKVINDVNSRNHKNEVNIKLSLRGPAVQMNIIDGGNSSKIAIDLVPAFEYTEPNEHVVAEMYPSNASRKSQSDSELLWKRSFSAKEKALLSDMDRVDQGCRKELLKIVKSIICREQTFSKLTFYHLKTAFLSYRKSHDSDGEWHNDKLAERFLEFLQFLHSKLAEKLLPHFWIPELNLFDEIIDDTLKNMECRMAKLSAETEIDKVLNSLLKSETCTTLNQGLKSAKESGADPRI